MSNRKDWQDFQDGTEVCEKDGKYFLKSHPDYLYDNYEEAQKSSEKLRSIIVF